MSGLEKRFTLYWLAVNGPKLVAEHRFHPTRMWRFDFAIPEIKLAIEIEGGTWSGGRHTRGSGFAADCEKYNAAAIEGWTVLRLTNKQISTAYLEPIARHLAGLVENTKTQTAATKP